MKRNYTNEEIELRRMALVNLQYLDEEELPAILNTLKDIPDAIIYSNILLLEQDPGESLKRKKRQIEQLIQKLAMFTAPLLQFLNSNKQKIFI